MFHEPLDERLAEDPYKNELWRRDLFVMTHLYRYLLAYNLAGSEHPQRERVLRIARDYFGPRYPEVHNPMTLPVPLLLAGVTVLILLGIAWRLGWLRRLSEPAIGIGAAVAGFALWGLYSIARTVTAPLPRRRPEPRTAAQDEIAEMDALREEFEAGAIPLDEEKRRAWREAEAARLNRGPP